MWSYLVFFYTKSDYFINQGLMLIGFRTTVKGFFLSLCSYNNSNNNNNDNNNNNNLLDIRCEYNQMRLTLIRFTTRNVYNSQIKCCFLETGQN